MTGSFNDLKSEYFTPTGPGAECVDFGKTCDRVKALMSDFGRLDFFS